MVMRRMWGDPTLKMIIQTIFIFSLVAINTCEGSRRIAQRRKDSARSDLYLPAPSAESLQALAQAMGAAGFESYTEGKALVKRLIPNNSQPDLDVVEHQGVIGKAGVDFPAFPNIPNTGFNCKNVPTGYYADLETDCQVFHICDTSRKISFLCPNGTIFSQSHLICDWWFKVDCASAPALYESSAEYYSNEQKKTQKITQSLSKNSDLQQIGSDSNIRTETRRMPVAIPSTTERLLRHRQRLQESSTSRASPRSFQALITDSTFSPTQRTQGTTERRRKNLVQLIANNFGNLPARTTTPTYTAATSTHRTTPVSSNNYNVFREMQVAAESASFTNNNNRQYLQDYNNKNYRPYPVYSPNVNSKPTKIKTSPTLTTLYDIRDKQLNIVPQESTTKRPTLVPYTKSYTTVINDKREPYTRPGVSLLKDFLEKQKNKTMSTTTTEKVIQATERNDYLENSRHLESQVTIESKSSFESATKIPQTTRSEQSFFGQTASSDRLDIYSSTNQITQATPEHSYQQRRERLMRKLNLGSYGITESTTPTISTEKFYGDLPNRPGLVVPPSLTPKTLHTLAIYYATALDNLSTTQRPDESESTTAAIDEYEALEEGLPALFSRQTINKYGNLFGHGTDNSELLEEIKLDSNGTYNDLAEDLSVMQSQNPLTTSPQIRELAQVFTHALSAYLQDPVQFRKVLSDIRPTQPSFGDMLTTEESANTEPTTTINEEDDEILGFSDDNKVRPYLASFRDPKALNLATDYPTVSEESTTTPVPTTTTETRTTTQQYSSSWRPFRCCGRISASYTSASTSKPVFSTPLSSYTAKNYSDNYVTTTENSYIPKYGGFQNNTSEPSYSPYGRDIIKGEAQPLSEYELVTNLPTAWGVDADTTSPTITNGHTNVFESKKIKPTTVLPTTTGIYFTETDSDSVELENEEELQRAHSQSFVTPQNNNLRQSKQIIFDDKSVKKPSEDLEAPTLPDIDTTTVPTVTQPTTIAKAEDIELFTTVSTFSNNIFTSPENEKTTYQFQWPSTFENWQSTVIDPITLNDNLSPSGPESQVAKQASTWAPNTATTVYPEYIGTSEQSFSSSVNIELTTPENQIDDRVARLLRDPTSTEPADITTITDRVVEKAKEIMGGMNATTTEKLMNVMKKTKSKTVKRLILLLVQTCDDDHNTTAEASKRALLEALMAVSQKDMDEIAREEGFTEAPATEAAYETTKTYTQRRADKLVEKQDNKPRQERRGKKLNFDPSAINSLSNPSTAESIKMSEPTTTTTTTTPSPRTSTVSRRGAKKFIVRTSPVESVPTRAPAPVAEARVAPPNKDLKAAADTRALELLRSLYTIAARWG